MVLLLLDKNFFGANKNVILVFTYVSPEGSNYYLGNLISTLDILENIRSVAQADYPDANLILAGDFNARTGTIPDYAVSDSVNHLPQLENVYNVDKFELPRNNLDAIENNFGRKLINMCKLFGVHILNGRKNGDINGNFTCTTNGGRSVVDYIAVSSDLFPHITDFKVGHIDDSDHFNIECDLRVNIISNQNYERCPNLANSFKYQWNNNFKAHYLSKISDPYAQEILSDLCSEKPCDIDESIEKLNMLQLNCLDNFCAKYSMSINTTKTKIIVFRNDGPLRNYEKWKYRNIELETVSYYKYLGVVFSPVLSWTKSKETQITQTEKVFNMIKAISRKCNGISVDTAFQIFDKMLVPILLYGSEMWGYTLSPKIENVQIKYFKYTLRVSKYACNMAVLGEIGRSLLYVQYSLKCVKYWIRLIQMPEHRLPKQTYDMLLSLDNAGRKSWVSNVKTMLFEHGFGYVWISQTFVGDKNIFKHNFKQRIKDYSYQEWNSSIVNNSRLQNYCKYKTLLDTERFLSYYSIANKFKHALCKFRCGSYLFKSVECKWSKRLNENICKLCTLGEEENEVHFLLQCNLYQSLREEYLRQYIYKSSSHEQNFVNILGNRNISTIINVSKYIYYAWKRRKIVYKTLL
ncbi:hypothetical protein LOTGIDRAFT_166878 [Lottia gigantea]|uniref:Endonuclease/exonuclease/phosphatase domain-containing protein n=1 Tax=Lottia gigantea TaxID=225164 RepID=V4BDH6_LOTGI|nr:hypothetical protein LOTGIDRAFT_166878 [Lottia gigantea]ESO86614.1 hypothetical protein LOTGIDRAFT_166878 [Lottia gigantea]